MPYTNTFITVAEDCPLTENSEIPVSNRAKKPMHIIQYELLTENPYKYSHQALIFEVYLEKEGIEIASEDERQEIWDQLFAKEHPCLRASALTKRYGFGACLCVLSVCFAYSLHLFT
ncbi:MAG: DUF6157 family protein, partial [Chloroflexota bacterium]